MKKKYLLLVTILFLLLTGCSSNNNQALTSEKKEYNQFIIELNNANNNTFNNTIPFSIDVSLEKIIDSEITYRVIIDEPQEPIKNIKAIAIHNYKTNDIFPTSGIFEDSLSLIPNTVNKKLNYVKGIILVGYIPYTDKLSKFDGTIKVLVKYEDNNGNQHQIFYKYQEKTK